MDALRRDMEELRVRQQDDIDRLTQEKRTLADEKAQLSREVAALNEERARWSRERQEMEERMRRLVFAGECSV